MTFWIRMIRRVLTITLILLSFADFSARAEAASAPLATVLSMPPITIFLDQKTCLRGSGCFRARLNLQCATFKNFGQVETTLQCSGNLAYHNRRARGLKSMAMEVLRTAYSHDGSFDLRFTGSREELSVTGIVRRDEEIGFNSVRFTEGPGEKELSNIEIKSFEMKQFEKRFVLELGNDLDQPMASSRRDAQRICHRHFYDHDVQDVKTVAKDGTAYVQWECRGEPELYN